MARNQTQQELKALLLVPPYEVLRCVWDLVGDRPEDSPPMLEAIQLLLGEDLDKLIALEAVREVDLGDRALFMRIDTSFTRLLTGTARSSEAVQEFLRGALLPVLSAGQNGSATPAELATLAVQGLTSTSAPAPATLRSLAWRICASVRQSRHVRNGGLWDETQAVCSFIFLRLVCPALSATGENVLFGAQPSGASGSSSSTSVQGLRFAAKLLGQIATGTHFELEDLKYLNPLIDQLHPRVLDFLRALPLDVPSNMARPAPAGGEEMILPVVLLKQLFRLHHQLQQILEPYPQRRRYNELMEALFPSLSSTYCAPSQAGVARGIDVPRSPPLAIATPRKNSSTSPPGSPPEPESRDSSSGESSLKPHKSSPTLGISPGRRGRANSNSGPSLLENVLVGAGFLPAHYVKKG
jgi:hypothetical protein